MKLKKTKYKVIFCLFLLSVMIGCGGGSDGDGSDSGISSSEVLTKINSYQLTTDLEGYGARPEIVSNGEFIYVIYLGDITSDRGHKVKIYDMDFNLINENKITSYSLDYGGPTDIRIAKYDNYVYVFYELTSSLNGAFLFGAKYLMDADFTLVSESDGYIANGPFFFDAVEGDETLDDVAPVVINGEPIIVTKINTGIIPVIAETIYRVRKLSSDLKTIIYSKDIDISDVMDGWATASGLAYSNGDIFHAQMSFSSFSPADPDIRMIRFDTEWNYDPVDDVFMLTETLNQKEMMPLGLIKQNDLLFLTHTEGETAPISQDEYQGPPSDFWLKVYDSSFRQIAGINLSESSGLGGVHSSIEVIGDKVYVAYGAVPKDNYDGVKENVYVDVFRMTL